MATLAPEPSPAHGAMLPAPFRVVTRRRDTLDTWTLELEALGGPPIAFAPGQFTMLGAPGHGEVPISISGDPDRADTLVHTVRAVGGATRAICASEPGAVLAARGPFGRPWPVEAAEGADVVVVAGGIGLAPLRPAILRLLARRVRYGRIRICYGGREPGQLLYGEEIEAWRRRGADVAVTVDAAARGWQGGVGVVTNLIDRDPQLAPDSFALVCGPEVMMRVIAAALLARGLDPGRIHLSLERNMQCGIGHCGHCMLGPLLVCRDGPVRSYDVLEPWLGVREL